MSVSENEKPTRARTERQSATIVAAAMAAATVALWLLTWVAYNVGILLLSLVVTVVAVVICLNLYRAEKSRNTGGDEPIEEAEPSPRKLNVSVWTIVLLLMLGVCVVAGMALANPLVFVAACMPVTILMVRRHRRDRAKHARIREASRPEPIVALSEEGLEYEDPADDASAITSNAPPHGLHTIHASALRPKVQEKIGARPDEEIVVFREHPISLLVGVWSDLFSLRGRTGAAVFVVLLASLFGFYKGIPWLIAPGLIVLGVAFLWRAVERLSRKFYITPRHLVVLEGMLRRKKPTIRRAAIHDSDVGEGLLSNTLCYLHLIRDSYGTLNVDAAGEGDHRFSVIGIAFTPRVYKVERLLNGDDQ